jgi:hypothetical protein
MGLADAVRARFALARNESLREAVRIIFASKEERRKIAARKFPARRVLKGSACPCNEETLPLGCTALKRLCRTRLIFGQLAPSLQRSWLDFMRSIAILLISDMRIAPIQFHQNRTISWLISTLRLWRTSLPE